jgi:hypothetical protein
VAAEWSENFADLLAHLQEEHTAFTAAKESQTV